MSAPAPDSESTAREDKPPQCSVADWPSYPTDAFQGFAGEVVRAIEPYSESDPVALLTNFLIGFGSAVGWPPHFMVAATEHHVNQNAVLVGDTAKSRKGESWAPIRRLLQQASIDGWADRVTNGLSTGEGLIFTVRDAIEKEREDGKVEIILEGVEDKRLLVVEPEFARVLRVAGREGNTLSSIIRQAWDSDVLHVMTRQSPLEATNPHISLLGHITSEELSRELTATDMANGFANRFLFCAVKRSKLIPSPAPFEGETVSRLIEQVRDRLMRAQGIGRMRRTSDAETRWAEVYEQLARADRGMVGSLLARGEAHVLRLSMIYALLDTSDEIRNEHLEAALSLWRYADASVRYLFGDSTGDPVADAIARELRRRGRMTGTEVMAVLGRNVSAARISAAASLLISLGKVRQSSVQSGGRPSTVWEWIG